MSGFKYRLLSYGRWEFRRIPVREASPFKWRNFDFFTHRSLACDGDPNEYDATERTTGRSVTNRLGYFDSPREAREAALKRLSQEGGFKVKRLIDKNTKRMKERKGMAIRTPHRERGRKR